MIAPSVGAVSNVKVPPLSPVIFAVPPSQVDVISKEESSGSTDVTGSNEVVGQSPLVV